jgi:phage terminase large subunit
LLNELQTFKYKEDKHGNTLEEPVEYNDDSIAALRYAVEPLFNGKTGRRKKLKLGGSKYGRKVRR